MIIISIKSRHLPLGVGRLSSLELCREVSQLPSHTNVHLISPYGGSKHYEECKQGPRNRKVLQSTPNRGTRGWGTTAVKGVIEYDQEKIFSGLKNQ